MHPRFSSPPIGVTVILAAIAVAAASAQTARTGIWATDGQRNEDGSATTFPAPGGRLGIQVRDGELVLLAGSGVTPLNVPATPSLTEVLWSPDSSGFVINASDGGLVGTWDAHVFMIDANGVLQPRGVRQLVEARVQGLARCTTQEAVNVGVSAWIEGGQELLIVAEVPRHSSCRNPGALTGFRVSVPAWMILETAPEPMLRSKWGELLGTRFAM